MSYAILYQTGCLANFERENSITNFLASHVYLIAAQNCIFVIFKFYASFCVKIQLVHFPGSNLSVTKIDLSTKSVSNP